MTYSISMRKAALRCLLPRVAGVSVAVLSFMLAPLAGNAVAAGPCKLTFPANISTLNDPLGHIWVKFGEGNDKVSSFYRAGDSPGGPVEAGGGGLGRQRFQGATLSLEPTCYGTRKGSKQLKPRTVSVGARRPGPSGAGPVLRLNNA